MYACSTLECSRSCILDLAHLLMCTETWRANFVIVSRYYFSPYGRGNNFYFEVFNHCVVRSLFIPISLHVTQEKERKASSKKFLISVTTNSCLHTSQPSREIASNPAIEWKNPAKSDFLLKSRHNQDLGRATAHMYRSGDHA